MRCIDFEAFESEFGQQSGAVDAQVSRRLQRDVPVSCWSSILDSNKSSCFQTEHLKLSQGVVLMFNIDRNSVLQDEDALY